MSNSPIQHGTNSGYTNRKCRCEACKEAHGQAHAEWVNSLGAPTPEQHGRMSTYTNYKCRCVLCAATAREYWAEHAERKKALTHVKCNLGHWHER